MTNISVFEFNDYKAFLKSWLESQPNRGRGQVLKIAAAISAHSTLVSQVLNGDRDFSAEQVFGIGQHIGLNALETEYLVSLLQVARAGTFEYKNFQQQKLNQIKKQALNVSQRLGAKRELSDLDRSVFYSTWYYMAIWIFIAVDGGKTLDDVCERFDLPRSDVNEVLEFLMSCGLAKFESGKYTNQFQHIHLEYGSPYLGRHHANWRVRSLEKIDSLSDEELMFTSPCSLSRKDFLRIREEIVKLIQTTSKIIKDSPEEEIACMNLDLFWIR